MEYEKIEGLEKPVSKVIFGTGIPSMYAGDDDKTAFAILDAAVEAGITSLDTANSYGYAEEVLGRWLQSRGGREKLNIITKGANPIGDVKRVSRECIEADLMNSLRLLHTDYIDVYFLHRDDESVPVSEVAEIMNGYLEKGIIKTYAVSNWTFNRINQLNDYCEKNGMKKISVISPSYSLADCIGDPWGGSVTLTGTEKAEQRKVLEESRFPIFTYSSLARGFLSGKIKSTDTPEMVKEKIGLAAIEYAYPINFERLRRAEILAAEKNVTVAQLTLAWQLSRKLNIFAINSTSTPSHLYSNLKAFEIEITPEEADWIHPETI